MHSKVHSFTRSIGLKIWTIAEKVVIIGSGATAITLVPAMVKGGAGHVTMLQRSPTYIASVPSIDMIYSKMRKLLPEDVAYKRPVHVISACVGFMHLHKTAKITENITIKICTVPAERESGYETLYPEL